MGSDSDTCNYVAVMLALTRLGDAHRDHRNIWATATYREKHDD